MTDRDIIDGLARELEPLPRIFMGFDAEQFFRLTALVQLAGRHPQLVGRHIDLLEGLVRAAEEYFAGCPTALTLIQRGKDTTDPARN